MEEVDNILLFQLKTAGCDVEKIESIRDFNSEHLVRVCAECLRLIFPNQAFAGVLPSEMSARYKICNNMASSMKKLGYSGEVGFNQFFYPNHTDVHKILSFLIGQLPSKGAGPEGSGDNEVVGEAGALDRRLKTVLGDWGKVPWTPFRRPAALLGRDVDFRSTALSVPSAGGKPDSKTKAYYKNHLSLVTAQPHRRADVPACLIEASTLAHVQAVLKAERDASALTGTMTIVERREAMAAEVVGAVALAEARYRKMKSAAKTTAAAYLEELMGKRIANKGSLFTHQADFAQDKMNTESMMSADGPRAEVLTAEEIKRRAEEAVQERLAQARAAEQEGIQRQEQERTELEARLVQLAETAERLERDVEVKTANIRQFEASIYSEQSKTKDLEDEYKLKKRCLEMLDDVEGNVKELQRIIAATAQRLVELGAEWETHRQPLIEEYRLKKDALAQRKLDCKIKLEQVKAMKEEMADIAAMVKEKTAYTTVLDAEFDKMPKGVSRSAYTRRIMEIVKNVKKQKAEIERILDDTKAVQKEINNTSQTLQRTFTAADELLFRDARNNEYSKDAYKKFAALHETIQTLEKHVEETGHTKNEIRELEAKIAKLRGTNAALDIDQVKNDIENIKEENRALKQTIKAAGV